MDKCVRGLRTMGDVEGFCNYTSIKREQDGEKDDSIQTYLL